MKQPSWLQVGRTAIAVAAAIIAAPVLAQNTTSGINGVVTGADGKPVSAAEVSVQLTKHAFNFGTAVPGEYVLSNEHPQFNQILLENFNIATLENDLKWEALEDWGFPLERGVRAVDWLRENGLRVRGHVGLQEDRRPRRVDARGDELRGRAAAALAEQLGVVGDRERVQVGDEEERLELVLEGRPLPRRTEVVAEVHGVTRRLDPREDARPGSRRGGHAGHSAVLSDAAATGFSVGTASTRTAARSSTTCSATCAPRTAWACRRSGSVPWAVACRLWICA